MPKPRRREQNPNRSRKERVERFLQRFAPEMRQAEMESKARELAEKDLLPSFFKWTRERMTVEIKHHALTGKSSSKVSAPVRAASLFREKQQLAESITKHFEIVYRKRTNWDPATRLAFLTEMKRGLLEAKRKLRSQKPLSLNEKLDELSKWKKRGLVIDESIEDPFLKEARKAMVETQKAVINTLLESINKKIAGVQKELKQG